MYQPILQINIGLINIKHRNLLQVYLFIVIHSFLYFLAFRFIKTPTSWALDSHLKSIRQEFLYRKNQSHQCYFLAFRFFKTPTSWVLDSHLKSTGREFLFQKNQSHQCHITTLYILMHYVVKMSS